MNRIKEDDINKVLLLFDNKNLNISIKGIFEQESFMEKAKIKFLENNIEFDIKNDINCIRINLSYIEEIYLIQKNKLKFLTNNNLEILISFS